MHLKTDKTAYAWPYFWLEVNFFDTANKCDITTRGGKFVCIQMAAWYLATLRIRKNTAFTVYTNTNKNIPEE